MISPGDIRELRHELESAGVFAHRSRSTAFKFAMFVAITAAAAAGVYFLPLWCAFIIVPLVAIPVVSACMIGHEGCHNSFADTPTKNAIMAHLAFPVFCGLGIVHWKRKHNIRHHGHPNVFGKDDDITPWPFATSGAGHEQCNGFQRWFQRNLQGYLFWPMTFLLSYVMRYQTFKSSLDYYRDKGLDRVLAADLGCQLIHYTTWLVIPSILFGVLPTLAFYAGVWGVAGLLMALIFAPAHIGLPIVEEQEKGWEHQFETTRNLRLPRIISWWFIGLDYQIEHHLFPRIPHQNMRRAAEIVEPWCERVGVKYMSEPYHLALADTTRYFFRGWQVELV